VVIHQLSPVCAIFLISDQQYWFYNNLRALLGNPWGTFIEEKFEAAIRVISYWIDVYVLVVVKMILRQFRKVVVDLFVTFAVKKTASYYDKYFVYYILCFTSRRCFIKHSSDICLVELSAMNLVPESSLWLSLVCYC